jgi:NAD(P)-dependent dehydrogenase (short-subunit alcohol dehydrogenase family)
VDNAKIAVETEIYQPGCGNYSVDLKSQVVVEYLDLESLESIRLCAETIMKNERRIDFLVFNAGVFTDSSAVERTVHGFEKNLGTNHHGHFYFYQLLLQKIRYQNFPCRVVSITDSLTRVVPSVLNVEDLHYTKGRVFTAKDAYAQSMLANVRSFVYFKSYVVILITCFQALFVQEAHDQARSAHLPITTYAVFPGYARTNLLRNTYGLKKAYHSLFVVTKTVPQAAATVLYVLLRPSATEFSGKCFANCDRLHKREDLKSFIKKTKRSFWKATQLDVDNAIV